MNEKLQTILNIVQQSEKLSEEERLAITKALKESDKEISITQFKLDRTEIVKRTTATLLEETIAELEQKRKSVELQNRKLEIEASLERVRAKAMAMNKSEDLSDAVATIFEQMDKLNFGTLRCGIVILNKERRSSDVYTTTLTTEGYTVNVAGNESIDIHPLLQGAFGAWTKQQDYTYTLQGEDLLQYLHAMEQGNFKLPASAAGADNITTAVQYYQFVSFPSGGLYAFKESPFAEETIQLMQRFANAFHLAYKRYEDLKQAESQTREAKIEAALERVRSRAMAMQNSQELNALIGAVFNELTNLDLVLTRCIIMIFEPSTNGVRWWMANSEAPSEPMNYFVQYQDMPFFNAYLQGWKEKKLKWEYLLEGRDKIEVDNFIFSETELSKLPGFVISGMKSPDRVFLSASFNNFGCLNLASLEPLPDEHFDILKRFGKVFDLTYTRFNDFKQAEAQAREAKIEAALERVRAKAMAMHSSQDLAQTIGVFYREMGLLSITPRRCGVGLLDKETHIAELSTTNTTGEGDSIEIIGKLKMEGHPVLEGVFDHWLLQKEYHPVLRGNEIREYYQLIRPQISYPDYPNDVVQYGYFFFFSEGGVFAWTNTELEDDELQVYRRFTTVLSLTYKRYKDIKEAEARTRIALRESSLDRVRAEIASMRTAEDLQRITPLIWKELTALGVPFFRCGVFIINENREKIEFYLSNPDGKPLAALHLDFQSSETINHVVTNWRQQQVYREHWDSTQFLAWVQSLIGQGQISTARDYQAGDAPPESLTLQFVPFAQGMMYVGSTDPLSESEIELVQDLAGAFSVAYARYEDFTKLEVAKEQAESALKELKTTQAQLIQSEKMASLGELTAGIAHEIQNPLNFVNNFSEVNAELAAEIKYELASGNTEQAIALVNAVLENEQKIAHHGKRAEAIVKSMLQHSRNTSGKKETKDINQLVDEYLRLSYHGFRAKEKEFSVIMETHFDKTAGEVNIIPEDIGRVLLNLFNNAFYSLFKKKQQTGGSFEPLLQVTTVKMNGTLNITVRDNGTGIPEAVLDKIFQPFFTTKPTGEGTGLGLSLSYDIVTKGHGGSIKADTREGVFTEFTISLPAK